MKRANILGKGNFEKLIEIEQEIVESIEKDYKEIKRPVVAFVIFTTQEARERCLNAFESSLDLLHKPKFKDNDHQLELFNEPIPTIPAPEATNIIWENLSITDHQTFRNKIIIMTVITVILLVIFSIFIYLKQFASQNLAMSPNDTNCESIGNMFDE